MRPASLDAGGHELRPMNKGCAGLSNAEIISSAFEGLPARSSTMALISASDVALRSKATEHGTAAAEAANPRSASPRV